MPMGSRSSTMVSESKVTEIVKSLNVLEDDLDSLNAKVGDVKKQLAINTQSQIDSLSEKTRQMATSEAEIIINESKIKAEAESKEIIEDGKVKISKIKSSVDANFDSAVENVVLTILQP